MRALAHRCAGAQRIPIVNYLLAAAAQETQAAVIHYDHDYDTLAEVMIFESAWLASPDRSRRRDRVAQDRIAIAERRLVATRLNSGSAVGPSGSQETGMLQCIWLRPHTTPSIWQRDLDRLVARGKAAA